LRLTFLKEYFVMLSFDAKSRIDQEVSRYKSGEIDADTLKTRVARVSEVRKKLTKHEAAKSRQRELFAKAMRALTRIREALNAGRTVVSIDVGRDLDTDAISDVGITTYRRGAALTTATYAVDTYSGDRAAVSYFGPLVIQSHDEVIATAQASFEAAGLAVFHGAHNDVGLLRLDLTKGYYVDTAILDWVWRPGAQARSLADLCAQYGICNLGWHESGNDAYRTMLVLLHQLADIRPPCEPFRRIATI
jgi:hypothetical protein